MAGAFNETFRQRTKKFNIDIVNFLEEDRPDVFYGIVKKQLLRCSSSVGANFRALCRAKSEKDYQYKLGVVIEEVDESGYWLEILHDTGRFSQKEVEPHLNEADELLRIFMKVKHNK